MAKIKVHPHPGTLSQVLKRKEMTHADAKEATGIDRKTLKRIDRGEEVKQETLQKLATKLGVPVAHFDAPAAESVDVQIEDESPSTNSVMLRKLDAESIAEMLKGANRVRWQLNLHAVDTEARGILEQLDDAVRQFHQYLRIEPHEIDDEEADSLRFQLRRLEQTQHVSSLLERLAHHRFLVLGADYLFWESEEAHYEDTYWTEYKSSRVVLLSVEPHGAQSRRVPVIAGSEPPKFAPDEKTNIFLNGFRLGADGELEVPF